jgi:hypothetical protein
MAETWRKQMKYFKRHVNLSGIVEQTLLRIKGEPGYDIGHKIRHMVCDFNYLEALYAQAGYHEHGGFVDQELFFTDKEKSRAQKYIEKIKQDLGVKFVVLWSLAGSGWNKKYPWGEITQSRLLSRFEDMAIVTVGDLSCQILEWPHKRLLGLSGRTTMRESCCLTPYVDLVVGPETGILNAAACYDTHKVIMLSHSSENNLIKYWRNVNAVHPRCDCHPCHRLIYDWRECPHASKEEILTSALGEHIGKVDLDAFADMHVSYPKCVVMTYPQDIIAAVEDWYAKAKEGHQAEKEWFGVGEEGNGFANNYRDSIAAGG